MNERPRRVNIWETFKRVNRNADGMAFNKKDVLGGWITDLDGLNGFKLILS